MAIQQAKSIRDEAINLDKSHEALRQELGEMIIVSNETLKNGLDQQQTADLMLANADLALSKAVDAVELGERTLMEAQGTYRTLQGNIFNKQTTE